MMRRGAWGAICLGLLPAGMTTATWAVPAQLSVTPAGYALTARGARLQDDAVQLKSIELEYSRLIALPQASAERDVILKELSAQIGQTQAQVIQKPMLQRLADISLAVGQPAMAAGIYQRLAKLDPLNRVQWLEYAGNQQLAAGAPGIAGKRYLEASHATKDLPTRRRYLLLAMDAHLANRDGAQALHIAKANEQTYSRDPGYLQQAILVALGQHDLHWAQTAGRKLVLLTPQDAMTLERQLDLELAAKDLDAARALAIRLVQLQPHNAAQRTRLARISDWSGQQELALEQWQNLSKTAPTPESLDRTMRIAMALERDLIWLQAAQLATQTRRLSFEEQQGLSRIAEREKVPVPLVEFLGRYAQRYDLSTGQWQALAQSQEQLGNLPAALYAWQQAGTEASLIAVSAIHRATLLVTLQRPQEAVTLLREVRERVEATEADFWPAYGDLEWDHGSKDEALFAYLKVWTTGSLNAQVAERLIDSWVERGEPEMAVTIASEAFHRLGQPRWLLLAMDAASRTKRWDLLRSTSVDAQAVESELGNTEMYWLLQAHIAGHTGDAQQALHAYRRALALNPQAVSLRVQLLMMTLVEGSDLELAEQLVQWQTDALHQSDYWAAYALANMRLHQYRESVDWFEKQVHTQSDDFQWQSGYLYMLGKADLKGIEPQTKGEIVGRLRATLLQPGESPKPERRPVLLALASVSRDLGGSSVGDAVLQDMLALGYRETEVYQRLVDSSLAQRNVSAAHHWLQDAQMQGQTLPAYQTLAVALEESDRSSIQQILDTRSNTLNAADRVTAMRSLGRNAQALALAERELLDAPLMADERLAQHRDELRLQQMSTLTLGAQTRDFSSLRLETTDAEFSASTDAARIKLRLAHNTLSGDGVHLVTDSFRNEEDLSLHAIFNLLNDPLQLTVGGNARVDHSLVYGQVAWTRAWDPRTSMRVDLSVHTLSDITPALRAVGSQDKLALVLRHASDDSWSGQVGAAWQSFRSRGGSLLGQGYRTEAALEKVLAREGPAWSVRVSGSSDNNQLADKLPPDLAGPVLPATQSLEDVVARNFSTMGVGTTLRLGGHEASSRQAYGLLDVWAGQQWPTHENAYAVRGSLQLPVNAAGSARIRLEGHYTNVLGGASDQADRGLGVLLQIDF